MPILVQVVPQFNANLVKAECIAWRWKRRSRVCWRPPRSQLPWSGRPFRASPPLPRPPRHSPRPQHKAGEQARPYLPSIHSVSFPNPFCPNFCKHLIDIQQTSAKQILLMRMVAAKRLLVLALELDWKSGSNAPKSETVTLFFERQGLPRGSAFDARLLDTKDTPKSRSDTERKVGLTA